MKCYIAGPRIRIHGAGQNVLAIVRHRNEKDDSTEPPVLIRVEEAEELRIRVLGLEKRNPIADIAWMRSGNVHSFACSPTLITRCNEPIGGLRVERGFGQFTGQPSEQLYLTAEDPFELEIT